MKEEIDVDFLREESVKDRDRKLYSKFVYGSDLIARACASPFSIWVEPNSQLKKIIFGEENYNDLPYDFDNEVQKGMTRPDLAEFVREHRGEEILCEALEYEACRRDACPLYIAENELDSKGNSYDVPLCKEFKMAFSFQN